MNLRECRSSVGAGFDAHHLREALHSLAAVHSTPRSAPSPQHGTHSALPDRPDRAYQPDRDRVPRTHPLQRWPTLPQPVTHNTRQVSSPTLPHSSDAWLSILPSLCLTLSLLSSLNALPLSDLAVCACRYTLAACGGSHYNNPVLGQKLKGFLTLYPG